MKIILSTGSLWTYRIEHCFALAAEAGFDGIELMVDQRHDTRQPDYLRGLMQTYDLPIVAIHAPFRGGGGWPTDHPGIIKKTVALAEAVGAQVVVHHLPDKLGLAWVTTPCRFFPVPIPGWVPHRSYQRWLADGGYEALQAETAVKLCIENMPAYQRFGRRWNINSWNTPEAILRFPHITLDTTHLGTWGVDPAVVWPRYQDHVSHVHLSNYTGQEHQLPMNGRLHLDRFLAQLAAENYQGAVSIEVVPDVLDAGQSDNAVITKLTACVTFCRQSMECVKK
ncbi:MAG: sugar phosphate isomerase/epimerase [Chloroflexi bacterium]|nr:sugar phosphate isomerase/epimerase [Chloroflexota bacterium]